MTDTEIDKRLALAIGYRPKDVRQTLGRMVIVNRPSEVKSEFWAPFDHTEWGTISPIAERFDLFPRKTFRGVWLTWCDRAPDFVPMRIEGTTPQRAIALAAIAKLEKS